MGVLQRSLLLKSLRKLSSGSRSQLPLRKLSLSNLPLLLPSTTSRELRLPLANSPSLLFSISLLPERPTVGCVRLPRSRQETQLSELPWRKDLPLLFQMILLRVLDLPSGALSSLLSS